jgi:hypothetical protein
VNKRQVKQFVMSIALTLALGVIVSHQIQASTHQDRQGQPPQADKLAEEQFKNIQVFKGLPASRVMPAMNFFTRSLGVNCTHCHIFREFEKDEKPAKLTARKMITMVQGAQKDIDDKSVSCYMCHRGKVEPEHSPDWPKEKVEAAMKEADKDQRPAETAFKNIQILKGVPAGRVKLMMQMFTSSLGVSCDHCHVQGNFAKDEKPAKLTARKMLMMVGNIRKNIGEGDDAVTCYTCHRGEAKPVSMPPPPPPKQ